MPKELLQNVHVDGKWYGPDYGNATVPAAIAEKIENPAAFEAPGTGSSLAFRADDFGGGQVPNLAALAALGNRTGSIPVTGPGGDELQGALDGASAADLRALAESRGIEVSSKDTKATLISKLTS